MFGRFASKTRQAGQAAVEMALIAPLLVACVMGGLDLSVQAVCARQARCAAETAAVEAAALVDIDGDAAPVSDADMSRWVAERFPLLSSSDMTVRVEVSEPTGISYVHKVYRDASLPPTARASTARRGEVRVEVEASRKYLTPLGRVFSSIGVSGMQGGFTCKASHVAPYDTTGSGW